MTGRVPVPSEAAIRQAILSQLSDLPDKRIEPLGEGWAFSAFRVGDKVLRFPRDGKYTESLPVESAVMKEVAPTLPLPVSVIHVHKDGPNNLPFTSHDFIAGLPVIGLGRPLSADAGAVMGRFLRAMHAFPVERASALGLEYPELQVRRRRRVELFEKVRAQVLPLVDADIGDYVRRRFKAFLNDGGNFEWTPCLSHGDIDAHNVLADTETGELAAVIDWGDLLIGDPAGDFTDILHGELGEAAMREQMPSLVDAAGLSEAEFSKILERSRFYYFCYPLHDVLYSLECGDVTFLEDGLRWLRRFVAEGR